MVIQFTQIRIRTKKFPIARKLLRNNCGIKAFRYSVFLIITLKEVYSKVLILARVYDKLLMLKKLKTNFIRIFVRIRLPRIDKHSLRVETGNS
jgi:hypothetical protein